MRTSNLSVAERKFTFYLMQTISGASHALQVLLGQSTLIDSVSEKHCRILKQEPLTNANTNDTLGFVTSIISKWFVYVLML
jgi:hypothetical protein